MLTGSDAQITKATERRARLHESFVAACAEADAMLAETVGTSDHDADAEALYRRNRAMIERAFGESTSAAMWLDVSFHRAANDWLTGDLMTDSKHSLRHYLPFAG